MLILSRLGQKKRVQVLEKNGLRLALAKQNDALAPRHVQKSVGDGTAS